MLYRLFISNFLNCEPFRESEIAKVDYFGLYELGRKTKGSEEIMGIFTLERFSFDCRIGIGFGFGFGLTTSFGWLVYLLWFWFYDSQVKTALLPHSRCMFFTSVPKEKRG